MKEYKIEVVIDEDGNLKAETFGVLGPDCVGELDGVLAKVEGEREERNTDDYNKKPPPGVGRKVRQGRG